jgi:hypothetical protein
MPFGLSEQGLEKLPWTTSWSLLPVKWNSRMSPLAAVTVSGVKTKPSAPTWTVWVADEPEAVVVAAAEDVDDPPPPPYCAMAKAGVRRAERKRVDAVKVCMLAGRINWRLSGI